MVLALLYGILVVLCFSTKNKKLLGFLLLALMFVLLGFSSDNADYENYIFKFQYYFLFSSKTEFLFAEVIRLCNLFGISYQTFLIAVSTVYFIVLWFWIRQYTENWPFVLALYAIFPLSMDIVQIRNTCALIFVYSGIFYILKMEKISLKDLLIFSALVLVGAFFHVMSVVVLLLFIFILFFPKKKVIRYTIIGCICIVVFPAVIIEIMKYISNIFHVSSRLMMYINDFSLHFDNSHLRKSLTVVVLLTSMIIASSYIRKHSEKTIFDGCEKCDIVFDRVEKLIICLYVFVPLTLIVSDTYRIVMELSVVFYVCFAMYIKQKQLFSRRKTDAFVALCLLAFAVMGIYLLVIGSVNIDSVWTPMFYSNTLIN